MKLKIHTLIGLLFLIVSFSACEKAEEQSDNYMMYNDIKYPLTGGILVYDGLETDESFDYDLVLFSKGIEVHQTGGVLDSLSGHGDGIEFSLYSTLEKKLATGNYFFDPFKFGNDSTFDQARAIFDYQLSFKGEGYHGAEMFINGGVFSVLSNGSKYEIVFNCTSEDGATITGYYKGDIMRLN